MAITPIFVLGMQRSGTTWAANLLAAHPQVSAVVAEDHQGVHESVFFSHFAKAYDWSSNAGRDAFESGFAASDYGVLTGLDRQALRVEAEDSPATYFRRIMDACALREGAAAWVEKSPHHSLLADDLARAFPDARFLCITRAPRDLLRTRLWSYGRTPPPYPARARAIAKSIASSTYHNRFLDGFVARCDRASGIGFADLKARGAAALQPFLAEAGLDPAPDLISAFKPNSSFAGQDARDQALTRTDRALAGMIEAGLGLAPAALLSRMQQREAAARALEFPDWVWKRHGGMPNATGGE